MCIRDRPPPPDPLDETLMNVCSTLTDEQGIKGRFTNVQALRLGFGRKEQENLGRL